VAMLIRIEESTWAEVTAHLLARDDVETAAILLAEAIETERGTVLAVRSWTAIPDDGYQIRRIDQIRIDPIAINRLVRPARDRGLSIVTIHSHPMALEAWFSQADDAGDARLLPSFATQVPGQPHGSLVLARSGAVAARLLVDGRLMNTTVRVIGRTLRTATGQPVTAPDGRFARQALALGEAGHGALRAIRVGVVGLGGVGSLVSAQLGHLGVGEIVLVDGDVVEESNLSRILAARRPDVGKTLKTEVARRYLHEAGLPSQVRCIDRFLDRLDEARQLATCDLILSCVDRHTPRALLNRLAYEALIPVIDMGSGFRVDSGGRLIGAAGRVVVVGPGRPCLACWGHLDPDALRNEALSAADRAALIAEGYFDGAVVPQPSVIPFNTMVAGAAVIELLRLVTSFAGENDPPLRLALQFVDGTVRRNSLAAVAVCRTCGRRRAA
jgi:molybdopterin/thiamine biosynthesis adenylyltransferase